METIIIKIEKGIDQYGAWVDGIPGIYGAGDTVKEVKKNKIEMDYFIFLSTGFHTYLHQGGLQLTRSL